MAVRVSLDCFPAALTLPDGGTISPCRVYVADNEVIAYVATSGEPRVYFRRPVLSVDGNSTRGYTLQVEDGLVKVHKMRGDCGCGNVLKRFNAFRGQSRVAVPL